MANIKAAKKDIRKTARRTSRNKLMYTELDKAIKAVKTKGADSLSKAYSVIDKMSARGIIKKNAAARKKSKLSVLSEKK